MTFPLSCSNPGGRESASLMRRKVLFSALTVLAAGAGLVLMDASSALGKESARTHMVEIRQFKFFPATLEVKAGDTIIWRNLDAAPHTATAENWDSGRLNRNQTWTLKVANRGTFRYICTYHPGMKGQIIVK